MTIGADGSDPRVVLETKDRIEAPNWSPDGEWLVYNSGDFLYRVPVDGSASPRRIEMGTFNGMSNDHVIAPDGKALYFTRAPHIYRLPWEGGQPKRLTADETLASWLHAISPDGETLVFCGVRDGEADLYRIPVAGGKPERLTSGAGYDDGPDYSSDGRWVYFNSDRSGSAQIWRVPAEGGDPEPITADDRVNWFPHPSPDGKWVVYLSYPAETIGHPAAREVILRRMTPDGDEIRDLRRLHGGQGTINSPSWSPDGKRFAFVEYDPAETMP
jgi:Tol biopolymer transport system component